MKQKGYADYQEFFVYEMVKTILSPQTNCNVKGVLMFGNDKRSMYSAFEDAQKLAFAPMMYQAVHSLRERGVLDLLNEADSPLNEKEIAEKIDLNYYHTRILVEAGVAAEVISKVDDCYTISKSGYLILKDSMTIRNFNFINDVCYLGAASLDDAIASGKPDGLKVFGDWDTIYEGLSTLPENVKKSWFEFDHFYSDAAFPEVMPLLFEKSPESFLDVGGNTGRFAISVLNYDDNVNLTILDHPGQIAMAQQNAYDAGVGNRLAGTAIDLLDHSKSFPTGFDIVWMSQFLDCFPPEDIVALLTRGCEALADDGYLYVMEPYIDRQKHAAASHSLVGTSLYFTVMANGTSRMYHAEEMYTYIKEAGLEVVDEWSGLGEFQTLIRCTKAK